MNVYLVVLSGAHTLGHVNAENSNYDGHPGWVPSDYPRADPNTVNAWDQSPTVFDNDYYFQLRDIVSIHFKFLFNFPSIYHHSNSLQFMYSPGQPFTTTDRLSQLEGQILISGWTCLAVPTSINIRTALPSLNVLLNLVHWPE